MDEEITLDKVLEFIESEADHSDIDAIWEAIRNEVEPDEDFIQDAVYGLSSNKQEAIFEYLEPMFGNNRTDFHDVESYIELDASHSEKLRLLETLKDSLNIKGVEFQENFDHCFNVETLDDHYKIKAFVEAYKHFTSEEIEERLKRKI